MLACNEGQTLYHYELCTFTARANCCFDSRERNLSHELV